MTTGHHLDNRTFHVITFGCQMNKHDSERIVGMLESYGARQVQSVEESEIVIFMTCCVRAAAETRLKGHVASLKNIPLPEGSTLDQRIIAIGGCIGQNEAGALIDELPHVSAVFGTFNLSSVPELLAQALETHSPAVEVLEAADEFPTCLPSHREVPWSAWLPISIGCNNFCTYCIVPYVRGREKSRTLEDITAEAQTLVDQGVKEITLLGQNVNSYGRDLYGEPRFADLLKAVSDTGIERLRFATSHPKDLTDEVIAAFRDLPNVMPALHLPVQSGSNRILDKMNRRYTREHYLGIVNKLREACPNIALSTDIIVGFPGETEQDFQDTYDLIDEIGYHQVFTFIYSPREGTPAAELTQDTPREVIQERFDRLVNLVQAKAYDANQVDVGARIPVLIEGVSKRDSSILAGKSPKNQTVHAPIPEGTDLDELLGTIVEVEVDEAKTWYLKGHII
ncbi:tRNA (N6-isopentenyl adenosine(37)-C2)-methylthiotransferase MiaB [Anaerotardibacter muris]|uniref:tRNA (N6-isopentenyl adenosine(37)-C2)-methylthiotransferase MiaB n=1 Tax=Anaerotardibacter muris TaxID=2941505 RepID=UPI00203A9A15|nr:tRNA (N6-isopentenyl adenosine(37)-C2)-methylthiotransferase MiaB [Anaerotardibacter muris]